MLHSLRPNWRLGRRRPAPCSRPSFRSPASSRFATVDYLESLAGLAVRRAWSGFGSRRRAPTLETRASPSGLPASGSSTRSTSLPNLKWQGSAKETARVPPTLDSPLSAAPDRFLSRDAVSAFPLLYVPLPQPLPGARYRVSAAPAKYSWRFCVNPSPRHSDRGDRPVLSPASDSQSHPRLALASGPCAYPTARRRGTKILVAHRPAPGWTLPDRPARRRIPACPAVPPLRRSSKNSFAPNSPVRRTLSAGPAQSRS